jgi:hemoglobin-like flavoprotein
MSAAVLIVQSLEQAAEAGGDLTDSVYDELFAAHPDFRIHFLRDRDNAIKGEMLSQLIMAILDICDGGDMGVNLIRTISHTHQEFGVDLDSFVTFFSALRVSIEKLLDGFDDDTKAAWDMLVTRLSIISRLKTTDPAIPIFSAAG